MTQIAQGAHVYLFPEPGQVYRVQADDVATVQVLYGAPSAVITLTAQSQTFGPYDSPAKLKVTANTAPAEYTLIRAHYAELTQAQIDGGAVGALASNNAGGVIEPDGDVPALGGSVTLPAMQTAFDAGTAPQKAAFQSSVSGGVALMSPSLVRVAVFGDSTSRNQYTNSSSPAPVGARRDITAFGAWAMFACAFSGGLAYFDVYACEGYSGEKTDQILSHVQPVTATETWGVSSTIPIGIAARAPQIVFDTSGTNDMIFAPAADIISGAALARAIAGRRAIWSYIRACGGIPVAVSLYPRQGSFKAVGAAMTQDELRPYTQAWNTAIKSAATADGVPWLDAYTPCAQSDGSWKSGYIYHNGADDITGVHPSLLATLEIAKAAAAVLKSIIRSAPLIPRLQLGGSPIYSASFVPGDKRQFFANFDTGMFPSASGWSARYNPQADGSVSMYSPTIDTAGGGTILFSKPANPGSRYADFAGPSRNVSAGQEYLWFFDVDFSICDSFAGVYIAIVETTPGSSAPYQPLCQLGIASKESPPLTSVRSGIMRLALYYRVPAGITNVTPMIMINRSAGGAASGVDGVYVANMGQLRLS